MAIDVLHLKRFNGVPADDPDPSIVHPSDWDDPHSLAVDVSDVLLGRATSGAGAVETIPCTAAGRGLLAGATAGDQRTALGLGALAVKSTVATSDIAAGAVTNALLADAPAQTLKGNSQALASAVEDLTVAQVKTLLALAIGDVAGLSSALGSLASAITAVSASLAAIATSGSASDLVTGTVPTARLPAFTGDVTSSAGAAALAIAAHAVTNAKLAQMGATTIKGNATGGTADPTDLSPAVVKGLLAISTGDIAGLAPVATSGSAADLSTGTLSAARLPGLTGDVTSSAGSAATTIAAGVVTNAKLANAAASSFKGNNTGSPAAPSDLTPTQAKTLLAIASTDVSGLATIATSGSASDLAGGTVPVARLAALTGDVTSSAGSAATTIAAGVVTNAKLANMAASSLKGNNVGSPGVPVDLTTAQVKTLLAIASTDVSGLATIATSGSASDLAAGTVPAARMPAHTGDVTSTAGSLALTIAAAAVTYAKIQNVSATQRVLGRNTAGAGVAEEVTATQLLDWVSSTQGVLLTRGSSNWAALANVAGSDGDLEFTDHTPTTTPAATKVRLLGSSLAGFMFPAGLGPNGAKMLMQAYWAQQHQFGWLTTTSSTVLTLGITNVTIITATGGVIATTNSFTHARRCISTSPATAAAVCGYRTAALHLSRQQGFHIVFRVGIADAVITTTGRTFVGLSTAIGAPTDVDPSGQTNILGIGCDANDTTLQLYAAGSSAQARAALVITSGPNVGGNFPANTTAVDMYELALGCPAGGNVTYEVTRLNTGDVSKGVISAGASLPATTQLLTQQAWRSNGATAAAVALALFGMHGYTDT